jgi:hypothetical protein
VVLDWDKTYLRSTIHLRWLAVEAFLTRQLDVGQPEQMLLALFSF